MELNATFIISIISFLMFVAIMNKIFYAPITNIVEEREKKIKKYYDAAESFNIQANAILEDRNNRLFEVAQDARKIIADKIKDFNNKSKEEINLVTLQAAHNVQQQKELLNQEKINSEIELKNNVIDLAQSISSKILGLDIKREEISIAEEKIK